MCFPLWEIPKRLHFLSAYLRHSLLKSLTSQRPPNYSSQVYTGEATSASQRQQTRTMEELWTNYPALILIYHLANREQQLSLFYLDVYRQGRTVLSCSTVNTCPSKHNDSSSWRLRNEQAGSQWIKLCVTVGIQPVVSQRNTTAGALNKAG